MRKAPLDKKVWMIGMALPGGFRYGCYGVVYADYVLCRGYEGHIECFRNFDP